MYRTETGAAEIGWHIEAVKLELKRFGKLRATRSREGPTVRESKEYEGYIEVADDWDRKVLLKPREAVLLSRRAQDVDTLWNEWQKASL